MPTAPSRPPAAGLCRTTDGNTWTALAGGGLPAISASVIACTDVVIDRGDATGNTVYAAFWGSGIYRAPTPWRPAPTFTQLTTGLPAGGTTSRISLTQSASSAGAQVRAVAGSDDTFQGLYRTTNAAGTSWELCTSSATVELYGAFTSDVNVDPTTPDVVYVSGVELYKCRRNAATGAWTVSNIGSNIHADSHTFAFHPTLNQTLYSGNDGGFFVSRDGGATWDDTPERGPVPAAVRGDRQPRQLRRLRAVRHPGQRHPAVSATARCITTAPTATAATARSARSTATTWSMPITAARPSAAPAAASSTRTPT